MAEFFIWGNAIAEFFIFCINATVELFYSIDFKGSNRRFKAYYITDCYVYMPIVILTPKIIVHNAILLHCVQHLISRKSNTFFMLPFVHFVQNTLYLK